GETATLTISVTPVDDPSVLADDSTTIAEDEIATGNVLDNDEDPDSDLSVVTFTVGGTEYPAGTEVPVEGGILVINPDGGYSFTPAPNWNGELPVITYTTNTGETATLTISVTPVDDPSVLADDSTTIAEDEIATGNVLDNDEDPDSDLSVITFTVGGTEYPAGTEVPVEGGILVINPDGDYSFTPAPDWNGELPEITYTTNTGETATLTISVTPVDDPSVLADDSTTIAEDEIATGNVLDNDEDPDSDLSVVTFTVGGTEYPAGTEVPVEGGILVINPDGGYSFTPAPNWNGELPVITYTTNTGETATLTISVTPVDDPSVLADDSTTIAEDEIATGNVLDNDEDPDSDLSVVTFTVGGTEYPAGTEVPVEGGILVINPDGGYSFTPAPNWNGELPVITYTTNTGDTANLDITVTPVDDAAILADDSNTVAEDTPATGNVLANDTDIDTALTVTGFNVNGTDYAAGDSAPVEGGTLVLNSDGSYIFTPAPNWNGTLPTVVYTTNTGDTANLDITVTPVDDAAILADDSNTVAEDTPATGNVLANDTDIDTALTVTGFNVNGTDYAAGDSAPVEGGTLVLNSDGSYIFTPAPNWNGTLPTAVYTTNTGDTANLDITVTPVDDAAILADDSNTVAEDTPATGNVLANDTDIDTALTVTGFNVNGTDYAAGDSAPVEGGTLVLNSDGSYIFTPAPNWNGTLPTVVYTTNTGDTANLDITVTPVDDAPIAVDDSITVQEDTPFSSVVDLDANDFDPDGDALSVIAGTFNTTEGGTIVIAADGSYVYTPPANFNGIDTV
ncbi:Ig-like domain-containing protein, partial [Shewanella gelidii]|uniref:Ig-like domain-containing protein n=1 Tax=Shewanella gelidii TaxID=1642821 RepID=UPI00166D2528